MSLAQFETAALGNIALQSEKQNKKGKTKQKSYKTNTKSYHLSSGLVRLFTKCAKQTNKEDKHTLDI